MTIFCGYFLTLLIPKLIWVQCSYFTCFCNIEPSSYYWKHEIHQPNLKTRKSNEYFYRNNLNILYYNLSISVTDRSSLSKTVFKFDTSDKSLFFSPLRLSFLVCLFPFRYKKQLHGFALLFYNSSSLCVSMLQPF